MGDQEKKIRTIALRNFTRSTTTLTSLLNANEPSPVVALEAKKLWEKVTDFWDKLQSAQDDFLVAAVLGDIETDKNGFPYLDDSTKTHDELLQRYMKFCSDADNVGKQDVVIAEENKRRAEEEERKRIQSERDEAERNAIEKEKEDKFNKEKREFDSAVEAFKRMNVSMKETLETASASDKRLRLQGCTDEFAKLKDKFVKLSCSVAEEQLAKFRKDFVDETEVPFKEAEKWLLTELKDSPLTSGGASSSSDTSSVSVGSKLMKIETVHLPTFRGEKSASPFLKFPAWKEKWESLIKEYPEQCHTTVLEKHLDEEARKKYIGWESNYAESMKRLNAFYGDPIKIVSYAMMEVRSPHPIQEGDYRSLLSYSTTLENNFNRLRSLGIESEMSNTSIMSEILRKFPRAVCEKWNEFLSSQDYSTKLKPFETFIVWLMSQREMWERMASVELPSSRSVRSNYTQH